MSIAASSVGGCWTEDELVHGAFTKDQWEHLRADFSFKPGDEPACDATCLQRALFGQQLFFEPKLSGPPIPITNDTWYAAAKTSCATCHDAGTEQTAGWYADTRAENNVSIGAEKPTPHNTLSVVNVGYHRDRYGWTGEWSNTATMTSGECTTPTDIVHYIALPKAMSSDAEIVYRAIDTTPSYRQTYETLFGRLDRATAQQNVELALDAYLRRLTSVDSPFDKFIAGNDEALDASATRGFAVFVGRGMCVECHSGPLFSDGLPHVTGVTDMLLDKGRAKAGAFLTPPLRHVAKTGPYMHNGSLERLADVIGFYRRGGDASGYFGTKDRLMAKLDISDDDAKDLEAFLRALTGASIPGPLRQDTHIASTPPMTCTIASDTTGLVCGGICRDLATDPANCGYCGNVCVSGACMAGACVTAPSPGSCPTGLSSCGTSCVDTASDPANCGGCGNTCMTGTSCINSMCSAPPPMMCPLPLNSCGSMCLDLTTDAMNCGACGNVCPANKPICVSGSCHA